jgi:RNA polymerase-binding protein DksA
MKKKIKKGTPLTKADLAAFKEMLLEKRNELLGNVNTMEDETLRKPRSELSNMPVHMADVGTDNYEMENTLGLMDSERKILREIDDALTRIENGTYGICEGTGELIPKQRLKAIPWARYCVAYAELLEKGGGAPRTATTDRLEFPEDHYDEDDRNFSNTIEEE